MIVIPPVIPKPRIPKRFVKQKCKHSELISVTFKVDTLVEFPEYINRYYEKGILNNQLVYMEREQIKPKVKYGFQIEIELRAEEYYKNSTSGKDMLDSYIIDKARNTSGYKKCVQDCIYKEDINREYNIESFIIDFPEFHERCYETEEYIPIY